MKTFTRRAIDRLLQRFDYRLTDVKADPTGLAGACARLRAAGFVPKTVLDVGVGNGTPWLYDAFPTARFELFEALESFRPMIEQATQGLDVVAHYCALGAQPSTWSIQVDAERPTSSTMARYADKYARACLGDGPLPRMIDKEVTVRTLDEFGPFAGPTLLKLDVEGYEANVLKGAVRTLQTVDVIISEVSVVRRTEAELSVGAFLSLLESFGFAAINIAEISPMGRGGPIAYMDLVFVRSDSPLRYG